MGRPGFNSEASASKQIQGVGMNFVHKWLVVALTASVLFGVFSAEAQTRKRAPKSDEFYGTYSGSRSVASASEPWELNLSDTFGAYRSFQPRKEADTISYLAMRGSLARWIQPQIQAGGEIAFLSESGGDDSISYFEVIGFGTYNFDYDIHESFYVKGGLGLYAVLKERSNEYENQVGFFAGAGKRFYLWNKIHYSPEMRFTKKGSLNIELELSFVSFSVMF